MKVQRITDEFENFSFSHIEGLYPIHIDASGCKYEDVAPVHPSQGQVVEAPAEGGGNNQRTHNKRQLADTDQQGSRSQRQVDGHLEDTGRADRSNAMRESLSESSRTGFEQVATEHVQTEPKCERQGFTPSICITLQV
jgi:hypothetical protein